MLKHYISKLTIIKNPILTLRIFILFIPRLRRQRKAQEHQQRTTLHLTDQSAQGVTTVRSRSAISRCNPRIVPDRLRFCPLRTLFERRMKEADDSFKGGEVLPSAPWLSRQDRLRVSCWWGLLVFAEGDEKNFCFVYKFCCC